MLAMTRGNEPGVKYSDLNPLVEIEGLEANSSARNKHRSQCDEFKKGDRRSASYN